MLIPVVRKQRSRRSRWRKPGEIAAGSAEHVLIDDVYGMLLGIASRGISLQITA